MSAWTAPSHWRTRPACQGGKAMRVTRVSLLVMVSLMLVGSLSAAATAQDDEQAPITSVTGTVVEHYGYEFSDEEEGDLTSYDLRGYEVTTQTAPIRQVVEWSDRRLPTDLWLTLGYTLSRRERTTSTAPSTSLGRACWRTSTGAGTGPAAPSRAPTRSTASMS